MFKHGFKVSHRADPFTARELVNFCRDNLRGRDRAFCRLLLQPCPGVEVVLETGMAGVHQENRREGGSVW
jgi:hypothetical protein